MDNVNNEMLEVHLTESYFRAADIWIIHVYPYGENIEKGKPAIMNRHNGHITPVNAATQYNRSAITTAGALKRLAVNQVYWGLLICCR